MLEKVKEYIERCYNRAKNYTEWRDIENCRAQAFGALTFAMDSGLVTYEETKVYWNGMWQKFQDLAYR